MIPLKLSLKNFLCYSDEGVTLDFSAISLASLSGDNGQGKSALLDAITWAVWGKARGTDEQRPGARAGDELIRLGTDEMKVDFSFVLDDREYRVIRSRKKEKISNLELGLRENDGYKSIAKGVREAQAEIDKLFKMDYETFISSAFILQGKADFFTQKSSSHRKEILSEILGLSQYDDLEKMAKEKAKELKKEIEQLDLAVENIQHEINKKQIYQQQLTDTEEKIKTLKEEISSFEQKQKEKQEQIIILQEKQREFDEIRRNLASYFREIEDLQEQIKRRQAKISTANEFLSRKEEITANYRIFQKESEEYKEIENKFFQTQKLNKEKDTSLSLIKEEEYKLEKEKEIVKHKLESLEGKAQKVEHSRKKIEEVESYLRKIKTAEEINKHNQETVNKTSLEADSLQAVNKQIKEFLREASEKLTRLKEPLSQCPLCRQDLDKEKKNAVVSLMKKEIEDHEQKLTANAEIIHELTRANRILKQKIEETEPLLGKKSSWEKELTLLQHDKKEGEKAQEEIAHWEQKYSSFENLLQNRDFAVEEREKLAVTEKKIKEIGYNEERHRFLSRAVKEKRSLEASFLRLEEIEKNLPEEESSLANSKELVKEKSEKLKSEKEKQDKLAVLLKELPFLRESLSDINRTLQEKQQSLSALETEKGGILEKYKTCCQLEDVKLEKETQRKALAKEEKIYRDLREAFSKKGIQALIIENTIPHLQEQANYFLSKFTNGQMSLEFITQKDNAKGGVIETLEIKIADDLGTRDYKLFSGGEAFRINLAIRLALSKILTHRAGTKLQSLVIDEGFGTQDSQGRDSIIEVIRSLTDDFEKIIVITHIDELKEVFPTRIHVEKTASGSVITVNAN